MSKKKDDSSFMNGLRGERGNDITSMKRTSFMHKKKHRHHDCCKVVEHLRFTSKKN